MVGGGPAGLAAAEMLAGAGRRVTVYDRMPSLGRKFLIAGRGGLNLTHSETLPAFLERYHPRDAGLCTAVEAFPPAALRAWCEGLGQPTFVGSSGRVFPRSFKASPLLRAWLARLAAMGVAVRARHHLVARRGSALHFETPEGPVTVEPQAAILALGGASWPRLGSDGNWVDMLERDGVPVAPLKGANVGFTVAWSEHFAARFAGAPLKSTGFRLGGTSLRGEAVITHDGLEGSAVYALSRPIREIIEARGEAVLTLDLRPDIAADELTRRLTRRKAGDSLGSHLRKSGGLSPVAAGLLREAHGLSLPDDPRRLAALIKSAPFRLLSARPIARAISTAGGVRFEALDARFMLRAAPGVFVAGEMLDWEAPTGGYLLQAAFATGQAAAQGVIAWLDERAASGA